MNWLKEFYILFRTFYFTTEVEYSKRRYLHFEQDRKYFRTKRSLFFVAKNKKKEWKHLNYYISYRTEPYSTVKNTSFIFVRTKSLLKYPQYEFVDYKYFNSSLRLLAFFNWFKYKIDGFFFFSDLNQPLSYSLPKDSFSTLMYDNPCNDVFHFVNHRHIKGNAWTHYVVLQSTFRSWVGLGILLCYILILRNIMILKWFDDLNIIILTIYIIESRFILLVLLLIFHICLKLILRIYMRNFCLRILY